MGVLEAMGEAVVAFTFGAEHAGTTGCVDGGFT